MSKKNGATKARADEAPLPRVADGDVISRRNMSIYVDAELDDEIRSMIRDLRMRVDPDEFNISRFAHEALRSLLVTYRKKFNNGHPWPTELRRVRIPSGRPAKRS